MSDCQVHKSHRPEPLGQVVHHIQPRAMGGPDVDANRVTVCPTGHLNIHRLLDDLLHGAPMRAGGSRKERALAVQGYDAWTAAGKPGHPVYEAGHP
ncbi:MAG: HNH endonuclease signature motif containing protein [Blastococcus sp.]